MLRLQSAWMRLPTSFRCGLAVASAIMTILSLPTLADGVAGWATWLSFVGSTAASYIFPTLGVVGLLIFSGLQIAEIRARKRNQAAGVLADIRHREGCPLNPARLETWTQARERDGIEVTVGKCNDCGRMAYRHGDAPVADTPDPNIHDESGTLEEQFSNWLRLKRAAIPDWPSPGRKYMSTEAPEMLDYNRTKREIERTARVEYHERFRERARARLGTDYEQANNPRTMSDLEAVGELLHAPHAPTVERPSNGLAPRPLDALAERLARLHDDGRRLKQILVVSSASAAGEAITGQPPKTQMWCEDATRSWDGQVSAALARHGDASLLTKWLSSGSLPAAHATLRRIEPATTLSELRELVDDKLPALKEIIRALGEHES